MAVDGLLPDSEVAAIRKRAEAATEGPWEVDLRGVDVVNVWAVDGTFVAETHRWQPYAQHPFIELPAAATAEFIAHARTDIPALLADRDELVRRLALFEKTLRYIVGRGYPGASYVAGQALAGAAPMEDA